MSVLDKNINVSLKDYYYYKEKGMYNENQLRIIEGALKCNSIPEEIIEYMINPELDSLRMSSIGALYYLRDYTLEQIKLVIYPGVERKRSQVLQIDVEKGAPMETIQYHKTCSLEEIDKLYDEYFSQNH